MRLAFVTPRYGGDIGTGPEHACRLLAEHVSDRHDIDVLSTCARDPLTWDNEYLEGSDRVRGVLVRRFAVSQPHEPKTFQQLSDRLAGSAAPTHSEELDWIRRLGPWSPGLVEHLKRQHRSYDAIVFFSLCHATTLHGLSVAPERSVVFPHVTVNRGLRFGIWAELLESAGGVGYFSATERRLIREYVGATPRTEEIVGLGVEAATPQTYPRHQQNPADTVSSDDDPEPVETFDDDAGYLAGRGIPFRRRHRLYGPFALYGGRVEPHNGCEEMLQYFDRYAASDGDTALVLMGVKLMKVPDERYVRMAGVLPDRERMTAYEAADVTLAPAADDLLAQSVLESLAVGTPVLASARNEAAVEHCRRANAGLYYADGDEFVEALRILMTRPRLRDTFGDNGRQYIRQHYGWEAVLGRFERLVMKARRSQG